jgi:hypothetical protein
MGEVIPQLENCATPEDDDCDGDANEADAGCVCAPGAAMACYTGPAGTDGQGICEAGSQVCAADGTGYGPCMGEVTPQPETCATPDDDDCDGQLNEEGVGCVCLPGSTTSCYAGPAGTEGIGICQAGTATCGALGTSYGPCMGEVTPQPESCATAANEDCLVQPDCGAHLWSKRAGDASGQGGQGIATDAAGNVYFIGAFQGTFDFGGGALTSAGSNDVFVVKFDPNGAVIWTKKFGDASSQAGQSIAVDAAGDVYIAGMFAGTANFGGANLTSAGANDIFVAKLTPVGAHLWSKRFGDANNQEVQDLTVDSAGNVIVTGGLGGTVNFGGGALTSAGLRDIFIAKFDTGGAHLWSKRFGDASDQFGYNLATSAAGDVYLTGGLTGTVNFGGANLTSAGANDIYLVSFNAAGTHQWSKRFGDALAQQGDEVAVDPAGDILLAGYMEGAADFGGGALTSAGGGDIFLAKFNAAGAHQWSKRFGDAAQQGAQAAAVDSAGNVILTGYVQGSIDFGSGALTSAGLSDIVVAKFDASGAPIWSKLYGDAVSQSGQNIAVDDANNVFIGSDFGGTVDFGGGALTSAGAADLLVAKLAP